MSKNITTASQSTNTAPEVVVVPNHTAKLQDNVSKAIAPFATVLGDNHDKIVNDIRAALGRWNKDAKLTEGEWKASASFKLTRKDGIAIQMPANNPAAILLAFGMRICELEKAGGFEIEATIPKNCEAWIQQHSIARKNGTEVEMVNDMSQDIPVASAKK